MVQKGEDPMSNLLSNVGGIDSSLFHKPQSMRDQRAKQAAPAPSERSRSSTPSTLGSQPSPSQMKSVTKPSPSPSISARPASSNSSTAPGLSSREADRKLSDMLGEQLSFKSQKPMRSPEISKQGNAPANSAQPQRPAAATKAPGTGAAFQYSDDLDNMFGVSKPTTSALSPASQSKDEEDPFALFGGLGTTQAAKAKPAPAHAQSTEDLLGGFSGNHIGVASPVSVEATSQVASPHSTRISQKSLASSDDWGGMLDAEGFVSPVGSITSQQGNTRRNVGVSTARGEKSGSRGDAGLSSTSLPDVAPPSYESVVGQPSSPPPTYESVMGQSKVESPRHRLGSPRSGGFISPRSHIRRGGSGTYQHFQDEEYDQPGGDASKQKIPAHIKEHRQQQQNREGDMKEQAKQWISASKGWLSGASKKVAQAVKETQAQINSRIEELDNRHGQGGPAPQHSRKSMGVKATEKAKAEEEIPQYYYEWAETIAALPSPEQVNTLAAMPEEDARTINKILRKKNRQGSMDSLDDNMLPEAKRRSLSSTHAGSSTGQSKPKEPGYTSPEHKRPPASNGVPPESRPSRPKSASGVNQIATISSNQSGTVKGQPQRPQDSPSEVRSSLGSVTSRASLHAAPSAPPQASKAPEPELVDLMGFGGEKAQPVSQSRPVPEQSDARMNVDEADLMGLGSASSQPQRGQQHGQDETADLMNLSSHADRSQEAAQSGTRSASAADLLQEEEVDTFFDSKPSHGGQAGVGRQPEPALDPDLAEFMGQAPASSARPTQRSGASGSMIDFGDEAGPSSSHQDLYQASAQDEEQQGEPEERKIARKKRLAEKHARMQKQLAEKQARDKAEEETREAQHDLRAVHRERVDAWKSGKKDNIRALLSTLHTILWEGSGWTAPGMTDLVEVSKVKRCYMKANLVVHPDKVKQKGGTTEQIVIADMAFDTLKTAWGKFEATELKR